MKVYLLKPSRLKLRSHVVVVRERGSKGALEEAVQRSSSIQLHESSEVIRLLGLQIEVFGGRLLAMGCLIVLRDWFKAMKAI
jgi:hypothetical protein